MEVKVEGGKRTARGMGSENDNGRMINAVERGREINFIISSLTVIFRSSIVNFTIA